MCGNKARRLISLLVLEGKHKRAVLHGSWLSACKQTILFNTHRNTNKSDQTKARRSADIVGLPVSSSAANNTETLLCCITIANVAKLKEHRYLLHAQRDRMYISTGVVRTMLKNTPEKF